MDEDFELDEELENDEAVEDNEKWWWEEHDCSVPI